MAALVRQWLTDLKVMNRSPQTIEWYQQKMEWYRGHEGGPATLDGLTSTDNQTSAGCLAGQRQARSQHGRIQQAKIANAV